MKMLRHLKCMMLSTLLFVLLMGCDITELPTTEEDGPLVHVEAVGARVLADGLSARNIDIRVVRRGALSRSVQLFATAGSLYDGRTGISGESVNRLTISAIEDSDRSSDSLYASVLLRSAKNEPSVRITAEIVDRNDIRATQDVSFELVRMYRDIVESIVDSSGQPRLFLLPDGQEVLTLAPYDTSVTLRFSFFPRLVDPSRVLSIQSSTGVFASTDSSATSVPIPLSNVSEVSLNRLTNENVQSGRDTLWMEVNGFRSALPIEFR